MKNEEYEATYEIIRRMFVLASSVVKEPSKELNLQFIYYGVNLPEEETKQTLTDLITKALELDDKVSITDFETSRFNPESDPGFLCKCKLVASEGMMVNEVRILSNTLYSLKNDILNDIIQRTLIKHAQDNIAISMLTGQPYFVAFEVNEEASEELLKIIRPQYEMTKKMITGLVKELDLMLEIIRLEPKPTNEEQTSEIVEIIENKENLVSKVKVVIHLRFVQNEE